MKDYVENKESSYLKNWSVNDLYGWAMSRKQKKIKRIENTSQFSEDSLKIYNETSDKGYFLEVDVQYLEK